MTAPVPPDANGLREVAERIAYEHAATVDGEFGCCHNEDELRAGGRAPSFDGDEFEPIPDDCPGKEIVERHLDALAAYEAAPTAGEGAKCAHGVLLSDLACTQCGNDPFCNACDADRCKDCTTDAGCPCCRVGNLALGAAISHALTRPATPPADDASREFTPTMERLRDEYVAMRREHYGFADLYAAEFDRAVAAAATRARAEGAAEADRLRAGIWALGESIYGEEGVEHNEGCEGEPDCLACIVADLRALLARSDAAPHTGAQS